jgi:hypothetical protein
MRVGVHQRLVLMTVTMRNWVFDRVRDKPNMRSTGATGNQLRARRAD